jgi:multicomponent Na+:H+ antiporter subunit G
MSWTSVADAISVLCLLAGAALTLVAAIGMVRFPDLLSRLHSATKPQVLGLLLVLLGLGFRLRDPTVVGTLVLVAMFQMLTTPVASHMVSRAGFRTGEVDAEDLVVDELSGVFGGQDPRGAP